MTGTWVGIDVGASATKVVVRRDGQRQTRRFSSVDTADVADFVRAQDAAGIGATGGGGQALVAEFAEDGARGIEEFQAWANGVGILAQEHRVALEPAYLIASVGTGTSAVLSREGVADRAGGCALGGGTLVGLGQLLLGTGDHAALMALAQAGDRMAVDLQIHDIYPDFPPGFTASNFGGRETVAGTPRDREDIAHALAVLVGENVSILCCALAGVHDVHQIVYGGGTLRDNPVCWEVVQRMAQVRGFEAIALPEGEFAGAEGALAAGMATPTR